MDCSSFKQGKIQEAAIELNRAATLLEDPEIYDHLGELYLKTGDKAQAKINWEKSLKMDPGENTVKEKLKRLNP